MNKLTRMLRAALTALTAGLIAGCTACFAVRALGFTVSWTSAYPAAAAAAAVVGLSHRGTGWAIGAAAAVVLALGAAIVFNISGISLAAREFAVERAASPEFFEKYASAAAGGALILGILLGALTALLLRAPSGVPVALTLLIAAVLCALTLNQEISIWRALPGLAAGGHRGGGRLRPRRGGDITGTDGGDALLGGLSGGHAGPHGPGRPDLSRGV